MASNASPRADTTTAFFSFILPNNTSTNYKWQHRLNGYESMNALYSHIQPHGNIHIVYKYIHIEAHK
jgi:hypothetical protein